LKDGHPSRRSGLVTALLLLAGAIVVAIGITFRMADLHVQTVLSGSMRPTLSPGDLAITEGVPTSSLRVGDVIVFVPPNETSPVIHRIASLDGDVLTTKGDANNTPDPWRLALANQTEYRLVLVIPFLGWLTDLQRPALLAAGLLMGLALLRELSKEVRTRRTRPQPQSQS